MFLFRVNTTANRELNTIYVVADKVQDAHDKAIEIYKRISKWSSTKDLIKSIDIVASDDVYDCRPMIGVVHE